VIGSGSIVSRVNRSVAASIQSWIDSGRCWNGGVHVNGVLGLGCQECFVVPTSTTGRGEG